MRWDEIESQWTEFAESAHAHWGKLTEADLRAFTGAKGYLIGRIKSRYGISRHEAEKQIDEWCDGLLGPVEGSSTK